VGFGLGVDTPVEVEENRVSPLTVPQEGFLYPIGQDLIVQPVETKQMIFGSFDGIGDHSSGLHDEGPIAGLCEKKFPCGLP
jgi:hypothetical protein